ncbi:MAG: hypothetical protein D8M52_00265 [Chlorobi bacterium]|nr:MAG: hypothetical protein F9K28_00990 [Bacteroidota bacterium]KXK34311.1 MAG: hypothetical protein UZ06_CHB003001269 [Chlorobi bacterium OLB6]MBE2265762.1 hypothetical protein [Flavobacteriales bacterium]MBL1160136.1 hypothetical protein [Chlorobiota bacterium]MBW7854232.1 hypothetical protein [Candidatus Kapabacteria bacterium]MCC6330633.1 hypothetical protein [Ignavibacteria bacterium]
MKRFSIALSTVFVFLTGAFHAGAQNSTETIVQALKTIDPEILQYFPRWRVCEPDLKVQIKQTFALMGYDKDRLDENNIVVTSAPIRADQAEPEYDLILIECGQEKMVAAEIAQNMRKLGFRLAEPKRAYCFQDIPPASPPSSAQAEEIINYMEPTNVTHAFTLSAFDQVLKIGKSGFWLKASTGTDQVGYPYWSSGESRIYLQRPLYINSDYETRTAIPYLINARLGFGYRLTGSMDGQERLLDFVPGRRLNSGYGGKLVGGIDFHLPLHPQFGVGLNMEIPLQGITNSTGVDPTTYYQFDIESRRITAPSYPVDPASTTYVLRSTGQATLFYNFWFGEKGPENFFRIDAGLGYYDVREAAMFRDTTVQMSYLAYQGVTGLTLYHPDEVLDWIYAKVEYRNQGAFPFGVSAQYSNQILLTRAYLPILGDWLYVEGKYSTALRDAQPWERDNFFMVSPVLRLNF